MSEEEALSKNDAFIAAHPKLSWTDWDARKWVYLWEWEKRFLQWCNKQDQQKTL